jgi:hypothetical protein
LLSTRIVPRLPADLVDTEAVPTEATGAAVAGEEAAEEAEEEAEAVVVAAEEVLPSEEQPVAAAVSRRAASGQVAALAVRFIQDSMEGGWGRA